MSARWGTAYDGARARVAREGQTAEPGVLLALPGTPIVPEHASLAGPSSPVLVASLESVKAWLGQRDTMAAALDTEIATLRARLADLELVRLELEAVGAK